MALWEKLKAELLDIIEWPETEPGVLVHRFDRRDIEIRMGARLIVRPGQRAVFVNEGTIADAFEPGTYRLETRNLPLLATLLGWKYGFHSPWKAEVYFIKTTDQLDRRWETTSPVLLKDADFGLVRIDARGNYSYRVGTSEEMVARFVGARPEFLASEIEGQIRTKVISAITEGIADMHLPVLELAARYNDLGEALMKVLQEPFALMGLEIVSFNVEHVRVPEEVEKAMDQRASMGALGNLGQFAQYQAANALRDAAQNEGGAGNMMGMMLGAQMSGTVGQALAQPPPPPVAPPALPAFHALVAGVQTGPLDANALRARIASGAIVRETYVWRPGMATWVRAGEADELRDAFAAVTPPPPPV